MAIMHELTRCPHSLNSYLLRTILMICAGTLWTCGNNDPDPYPFVVLTLSGIPPSTKFVELKASVDTLNSMKTIEGVPSTISFFLPTKGKGGEGSLRDLVGKTIGVTVNAFDTSCQLATNDVQTQMVLETIQQDMNIMLHSVPSCSTLLTITMKATPLNPVDGMDINYTITVNNQGSSDVPAEFTTYVPENTSYESLSALPDWMCGMLPKAGVIGPVQLLCKNSSFKAGSQASSVLTVKVKSGFVGAIANNALVRNVNTSSNFRAEADTVNVNARNEVRPLLGCGFRPGQAK